MSLAVKILLILNLILALAVAYYTMIGYATDENWKRRWDSDTRQLAAQLVESNKAVTDLSFDKARAESALNAIQVRITDFNNKVKEQETSLTEKTAEITRLSQDVNQKAQQVAASDEKFLSLSASLELARQNANEKTHIAQVARAAAFQLNVKLAEVEDDLNTKSAKLASLEEERKKLGEENEQNKALLAILKERNPTIWSEIADQRQSAALLQGIVAAVTTNPQGKQDLVVLTIGKNDKVEEGTEFIILRGNKYIAKVRVEKVMPDMVSCRVLPESWNKDDIKIQQGDSAQNRL